DSGSYAASARAHGVRRHMKRDWEIYEDAARVAVSNVLRDIGVTSVDEKCKVKGQSATEWEIDARAWLNGSERFLLVEARRHCTSGLRQEEVAAIAFRVQDIGACGAIVVSPLPLQEGAKLVASHA